MTIHQQASPPHKRQQTQTSTYFISSRSALMTPRCCCSLTRSSTSSLSTVARACSACSCASKKAGLLLLNAKPSQLATQHLQATTDNNSPTNIYMFVSSVLGTHLSLICSTRSPYSVSMLRSWSSSWASRPLAATNCSCAPLTGSGVFPLILNPPTNLFFP